MSIYVFTFRVSGLDVANEEHVNALFSAGCDDSLPSYADGVTQVTFYRERNSSQLALCSALHDLESAVPGARVEELERELVSTSDIADRTDRTRESIRLLAEGKRGPGGFPAPVASIGGGSRVWDWADVNEWFREHQSQADEEVYVPWAMARIANGVLAERQIDPAMDFEAHFLQRLAGWGSAPGATVRVATVRTRVPLRGSGRVFRMGVAAGAAASYDSASWVELGDTANRGAALVGATESNFGLSA